MVKAWKTWKYFRLFFSTSTITLFHPIIQRHKFFNLIIYITIKHYLIIKYFLLFNITLRSKKISCNSFVMTYVGVKCLTRHCSVLRDTRTRGTT